MKRVRVVHWKAGEATRLIEHLRDAGYQVDYDSRPDYHIAHAVRAEQPAAVVIDLSRLPSHGREIGTFLRGSKTTRHIPLVFVNGAPEKVEAVRTRLPDAVYTTTARLGTVLKQAIRQAPASPIVPAQMMERYSGRTVAQKLGIAAESKVALFGAPKDYEQVLGELPAGVELLEQPRERCPVTLWFVRDPQTYHAGLARMKARAAETKLWILWPKQKKDAPATINLRVIRDSAIAVGLVDYKVCAAGETWSGLAFAVKKS